MSVKNRDVTNLVCAFNINLFLFQYAQTAAIRYINFEQPGTGNFERYLVNMIYVVMIGTLLRVFSIHHGIKVCTSLVSCNTGFWNGRMLITYLVDVLFIYILIGGFCSANEDEIRVDEMHVDEGGNLTLPCLGGDSGEEGREDYRVYWIHEGKTVDSRVLDDNSLFLQQIRREEAGSYKCASFDYDKTLREAKVFIRTPPPKLANVTLRPSTILATMHWAVEETGGYPITSFSAQYRVKHVSAEQPPDKWHKALTNGEIDAEATQIDVYHLEPNTTYIFEVWANNELGEGEIVQVEGTTQHDEEEIELGRHLLDGVESFDTRYWVAAVAVVMGTLVVLALGTCFMLYREFRLPIIIGDEHEVLELVPNIVLNPGYHEWIEPDENYNQHRTTRLNNNTVLRPFRV